MPTPPSCLLVRAAPLLLCLGLLSSPAMAADEPVTTQPRWEAGLGVGLLSMADYPGSDKQKGYVLPVPYLVYRGDTIQADRNGLRGKLFDSDRLEVQLSLAASAPVRSNESAARQGMPNLDPTFEFGPEVRWHLYKSDDASNRLDLRLPIRAVYAADRLHVHAIGAVAAPALNLDVRDAIGNGWNLGINTGPLFGSRAYHTYYYGVDQVHATTTRPAYEAGGGYSGLQFTASLSRRSGNYWFGGFVRAQNMRGAVYHDSPLLKKDTSFAAGIAIAYVFAKSSEQVSVKLSD
ncbi:MipA/OmpV family protein [Parachitinimonas caeni]|uniref:MipA/OmpV family protein n=1 Tax=Parachitinimonas caeni TaxID=3031301 RepID=A0ABT7DXW2_9NEIS|nr:MipA/OmpV family protein [Parachitinimonas caeni]MDK2124909.1 MipA/OmpV family protein [Parachitinimonas caeni]